MKKHRVNSESVVALRESVVRVHRTYFSIRHIKSAIFFAKEAGKIESSKKVTIDVEKLSIHQAYVIASIFATVAFLEANINEIYGDSCDIMTHKMANDAKNIPESLIEKLGRMWQQGVTSYSILRKYQIAFVIADKPEFTEGSNPYQDVCSLIDLRNGLMHPKPKSVSVPCTGDHSQKSNQEFLKKLRSKFAVSSLAAEGDIFYPSKCLSYGCSKWGIESSLAFADEFCNRSGISCEYQKIRLELVVE